MALLNIPPPPSPTPSPAPEPTPESATTKACPFCRRSGIECAETTTCRWGAAFCLACGAQGPEVRKGIEDTGWKARAIEAWNKRG